MEISASLHDFYAALGTGLDHIAAVIARRVGRAKDTDDFTKLLARLQGEPETDDPMLDSLIEGGHILRSGGEWKRGKRLKQIAKTRRRLVHHEPYGSKEGEHFGQTALVIDADELKIRTYQRVLVEGETNFDLMERVRGDYLYVTSLAETMARVSGYSHEMPLLTDEILDLKIT